MTRAEIEQLEGRALDVAVVECVLGVSCPSEADHRGCEREWHGAGLTGQWVPRRFHADWAAMGLVVDRLTATVSPDGDYLDVTIYTTSMSTTAIVGELADYRVETTVIGSPATAVPTAVARLALLAMLEVPDGSDTGD
jgi:hypothetical protein